MGRVSQVFPNHGEHRTKQIAQPRAGHGGSGDLMTLHVTASYPQAQGYGERRNLRSRPTRGLTHVARFGLYVHNEAIPEGADDVHDLPARGRGVEREVPIS